VAVLVGPTVATAATEVTERVMIPAAAFIPTADDYDFDNSGRSLLVNTDKGFFAAPLAFPAQKVRMKRIALYAYDDDPHGYVCVNLYRSEPSDAIVTHQGGICTADKSDYPQKADTGTRFPRFVNTGMQAPFLWVVVEGDATLFGVAVTYTYTP
jgi:hypothetical protein